MASSVEEVQNLVGGAEQSDNKQNLDLVESKARENISPAQRRKIIFKKIQQTTLPLVVVGTLSSLEVYIRSKLITNEDSSNLAVEGLHAITFGFILATDSGLLNPAVSLMSQAFGAGNLEEVGQIAKTGWWLGLGLAVPTIGIMLNAEHILKAFGQDPDLSYRVAQYARAACGASPAIYWLSIDTALLKTTNRSHAVLAMTALSALVGIGMSYLLIPGNSIIPKQGVIGSGYATLTQVWVSWLSLKVYFLTSQFRPFKLNPFHLQGCEQLKKFFKFGTPSSLASGIDQVRYFMTGMMIGWLGPLALALNQATDVYLQFTIPPILGIRQGTQVFVGQYKGLQDNKNLRYFGNLGILLENCILIPPLILYASIPDKLAANFLTESDVEELDAQIRLVFITKILSRILETVQGPLAENLKALLDNCYVAVVQIVSSLALVLPLSYVMGFVFDWELAGVNSAILVGAGSSIPPLLYHWLKLTPQPAALDNSSSDSNAQSGPVVRYDSKFDETFSRRLSSVEAHSSRDIQTEESSIDLQPLVLRQFEMSRTNQLEFALSVSSSNPEAFPVLTSVESVESIERLRGATRFLSSRREL